MRGLGTVILTSRMRACRMPWSLAGQRFLVAMGQPRQEKWVALHRERLGNVLAVGVGGAFDVFSGRLSRAPVLMQRIGMEWLYRLFQEPGRWRKDLRLMAFVLRVLATRLGLYSWRDRQGAR